MHPAPQHPRNSPYPTGRSTLQARGKLALLVSLLALAILLLVPAVVFAEAPVVPQGLSATSGDGTMDLSWSIAERAEGGYQYRYATDAAALLVCVTPPIPGSECEWKPATDSAGETTYKIQEGTLTVGTTYFFQVRAVNDEGTSDDDSDDTFSDPSAIDSAVQRAKPPEVENLVATAGNAQVTLTWTHLAAYDITSYIILREGGSGRGTRTSITEEEYELNDDDTEATYTVEKLVNGTEYSFHVKGRNIKGERDDPPRRTSSL